VQVTRIILWLAALARLAPGYAQNAAGQALEFRTVLGDALKIPGGLQSRLRFEHLSSADGLSNDSVFAILQDHRGFMWFGTQGGLNRYDGYRVTQYRHDPKDPHSLGEDFVQTLYEDRRGGIWSGTSFLSRFDPDTETFTRYLLPYDGGGKWGIVEDQRGFLWALTPGGHLFRFDSATGTFNGYDIGQHLPGDPSGFRPLHADVGGILWLGTADGLVRFDPATGGSIRYRTNPSAPVLGIASDRSGRLWLATTDGARNLFDPVTREFIRNWSMAPHPEDPQVGLSPSIYADPSGTIWRGTSSEGVKVFDPHNGTLEILRSDPADPHSLSGNQVLSIAADREGGVWVGVKGGGVSRLPANSIQFGAWRHDPGDPDSLNGDNVRAIYGDRTGSVWMGTFGNGMDRFEPGSGKFVHYRHDPKNPRSLDSDWIYSIYQDRSGMLWAGTIVGINRLDLKSGVFEHFSHDSIVPRSAAQPVYSFLEDRLGRFWFGVGGLGGATALLDRSTGAVTSLGNQSGLAMLEDHSGNLWLDSNVGLEKMESGGKVHPVPVSLSSGPNGTDPAQVNYLYEDSQGILWLATETGLVRLDPKTEKYTTYTTREGLPDNVVQCILSDQSGNLWLSTNNGLSIFNPRESTFYNYHESDGLQRANSSTGRPASRTAQAGCILAGYTVSTSSTLARFWQCIRCHRLSSLLNSRSMESRCRFAAVRFFPGRSGRWTT
jgi:ligand-binding sensor domain-containing protein